MLLRPGLFAAVLLSCSACASLNEHECRSGDWRQIGYQDGLRGYSTSRLDEHRQSCAKHGAAGDANAWHIGYVQGQGVYCTAASGYREGRDNRSYGDVCPPEHDARFRPAYEEGREVGKLVSRLRSLESDLDRVAATLEEDDRRSAAYLDAVRAGRKPPEGLRLLDRGERWRVEQDYGALSNAHRDLLDDIAAHDRAGSERYGVTPLRLEPRRY